MKLRKDLEDRIWAIEQRIAQMPRVYKSGYVKDAPKLYVSSGLVSTGTITLYITDDGTATGNAMFTSVWKESLNWWIDDGANQYQLGSYTVAGDMKSITLNVNRLGTVLLGLIQFITGADGVIVNISIWGL